MRTGEILNLLSQEDGLLRDKADCITESADSGVGYNRRSSYAGGTFQHFSIYSSHSRSQFSPKVLGTRCVECLDFPIAVIIDPFALRVIWATSSLIASLWCPAFRWLFQNVEQF
jgi:hypothetical protein